MPAEIDKPTGEEGFGHFREIGADVDRWRRR